MFKNYQELSKKLNEEMQLFIDRLDMTQRDRDLFYNLIMMSFHEGKMAANKETQIKSNEKE